MTKTKKQLRAEAVERLKGLDCPYTYQMVDAIIDGESLPLKGKLDAIIDLLTDDKSTAWDCYGIWVEQPDDKLPESDTDSIIDDSSKMQDERAEARAFADRLHECAEKREDVTLFGVDYTPCPLDADGVPIHIGDRMEDNERVVRMVLTDGSWEPSVLTEKLPNILHEYFCYEVSHCHATTVEDVLQEFASEFSRDDTELCDDEIIERFAAKLRLAGDAE